MKVSEITKLKASKFGLYAIFGNGKDCLAAKVNCAVLSTEGDDELAEIIAERFNAFPELESKVQNQEKLVESYGLLGLALTKLRDAVKSATPEALAAAIADADKMIKEVNQAAEEREQKGGSDE